MSIPPDYVPAFWVSNLGDVPINIDEYVMLLSPHPLDTGQQDSTQDGVLTFSSVDPGDTVIFNYGESVISGYAPDPKWWCTELYQATLDGVPITLGGETLPFAIRDVVEGPDPDPQPQVWYYMEAQPTLVVGKTPLWKLLPGQPGTALDITIAVTNIAVYDGTYVDGSGVRAVNSIVQDTIPPGYSYDPAGFDPSPYSVTVNPDRSTTLAWRVTISGADVSQSSGMNQPSPYHYVFLNYTLILPRLAADRYFLPRAVVDVDGDGQDEAESEKPLLEIMSANRAPEANAGGPYMALEGTAITFDASASSDPDNDSLTYRWDFSSDGTWDTPWMTEPTLIRTWGDDYSETLTLQVSDGDLIDNDTTTLDVVNVPPEILSYDAFTFGNLTLRIAGEKWHDVNLTIYRDGVEYATVSVVRYPGSPDDQAARIENVSFGILDGNFSAIVKYTPMDDPINGQIWGATPAWLIFTASDGSESRIHHTFNARHNDTWIWQVDDLGVLLVGTSITVSAMAADPGSDDLTFTWDWGDGTAATVTTFYNDGTRSDSYPSLDGIFPFTAADSEAHAYASTGTFDITLKVSDDDGGVTELIVATIII